MIDSKTWVMFTVAALAVIATPGPDIFYVLSRAISAGRRAGSVSALGIASGEVVHTLLAVFGLAALLQASTVAFSVLKYVGAVYLVYLGMRAISDRGAAVLENSERATDWKVFRQAVFTNLFNPKAILFYFTFLPQFVNPSHGHAQLQLVVLGLTFALLDILALELLARSAGRVYSWLSQNARNERTVKWGTVARGNVLEVADRQRVVRLLVHEILVGRDNITIRHSIPMPTPSPDPNDRVRPSREPPEPKTGSCYLLRSHGQHASDNVTIFRSVPAR